MTKQELIKDTAEFAGVSQAAARRCLESLESNITHEVSNNGRFAFPGLGVLKRAARKACQRNNPQKPNEKISVPAHFTVTFKPSPDFFSEVNK
jgi:nucleoid DNA-binding protein